MAAQYAYVMKDMTKTFPGANKPVLSNINLQFYQSAKIGIVGPNGAGKSTLIKIMAGIDKDFSGEAWPGENITVGYLEQEPQLDPTKTVLENVKDGARGTADMVDRFNAIALEMAEDGADFDALGAEMGDLQAKIARARDQLLVFLDHPGKVEATNNGCERLLRPAVVQRKVTNGYRAMWAAEGEADIRTVVDTARLTGASTFGTILKTVGA